MKNFIIKTVAVITFTLLTVAMLYGYLDYRLPFLSSTYKLYISLAVVSGSAILSTLIFSIAQSE